LVDAGIVLLLLFVACILASAVSLILRYRHSGGEVREQIKWIALAGLFVGLLAFLSIVLGLLIVPEEFMKGSGGLLPLWLQGLLFVMVLSFTGVPVAIGFAVLKYRLYDNKRPKGAAPRPLGGRAFRVPKNDSTLGRKP
jgi:hypothetical protein